MTRLNWGLLSTAHINRKLIPPLGESERNRLVAVASRDAGAAQAYAAANQIERAYGSYDALLADPAVDVIYNPLPNHLHAEWTIRALRAGKHVLCEKPLALKLAEVDAIAAAAAESGRVVQEAFMYRHHPQTVRAKALIAEGTLGDLQLLRGSFSFPLDQVENVRWVREYGGGAIWDVGCYPISYLRTMVGSEPLEVSGQMVRSHTNVDLAFTGLMMFAGDILAQFDCAFRSPPPRRTSVEVVGSQAVMVIPQPFTIEGDGLIEIRRGDRLELITVPGGSLYRFQVENMADAILDGVAPRISLADSRANTAAILALLRAAESGAPALV